MTSVDLPESEIIGRGDGIRITSTLSHCYGCRDTLVIRVAARLNPEGSERRTRVIASRAVRYCMGYRIMPSTAVHSRRTVRIPRYARNCRNDMTGGHLPRFSDIAHVGHMLHVHDMGDMLFMRYLSRGARANSRIVEG